MVEVASAEVALGEVGLDEVIRSLDQFAERVDSSMEQAALATEKATEVSKTSIVAFAALGAAMGTVFVDFIRQSSVISTLGRAFGAIFGSVADRILVHLVPSIMKLIPVLLDLGDEFVKVGGRIIDDLVPAFDKAIEGAGDLSDAFAGLDDDTQDLILGIGALAAGLLLIPAHPIIGLTLAFGGLLLLGDPFETLMQGIHDALLPVWEAFTGLDVTINQFMSDTIGAPAERALRGFAHEVQEAFKNAGQAIAIWAVNATFDVQGAFGGLIDWFRDLWDRILIGVNVGWAVISNTLGGIPGGLQNIWNGIVEFFRGLWDRIFGTIEGPFNIFLSGLEGVLNVFGNFINSTFGLIPGVPHVPTIGLPRLEVGGEVLETGAAMVHTGEVIITEDVAQVLREFVASGPSAVVTQAAGGGPGVIQHFEFNTTYHIEGGIPVGGVAMEAFKRLLDEHSRKDAERIMSKLRRRT